MKLSRQEEGWMWQGAMKDIRWASVERGLRRLEVEWRAEVQARV